MNLYIHVPFCAQRCAYCDFYTQTNLGLRVRYLEALHSELRERASELPQGSSLTNIYFGGGTPSLLSIEELGGICSVIEQCYEIDAAAEITLEANPDDITADYAEGLRALPINRVSMGVQSFQEDDLIFLNRRHNREQVYQAVERLRAVGIDNISLDLIYGLPRQTVATWQDNLERIIALNIPHISAYHLIYEEGTPLTRLRDLGRVEELSEELSLQFFEMLIDNLKGAGYEHYEISNFAKPNKYARLNTGYWQGVHYIGAGPAAHSYDGVSRSYNVASIRQYVEGWEQGKRIYERECLTEEEKRHEYIMTRLRTQWGIDLVDYAELFGASARERLVALSEPFIRRGQLYLDAHTLKLSLQGVFTSDGIIAELFD